MTAIVVDNQPVTDEDLTEMRQVCRKSGNLQNFKILGDRTDSQSERASWRHRVGRLLGNDAVGKTVGVAQRSAQNRPTLTATAGRRRQSRPIADASTERASPPIVESVQVEFAREAEQRQGQRTSEAQQQQSSRGQERQRRRRQARQEVCRHVGEGEVVCD